MKTKPLGKEYPMKKCLFVLTAVLMLAGPILAQPGAPKFSSEISTASIRKVMKAVADWQLANPGKHSTTHWTYGACFAGLTAWAQMNETDQYFEALKGFGEKNNWQLGSRPYHADDHAVAQMYLSLYEKYRDPAMIAPLMERFDWILANQPDTPLTHDNKEHKKRYNWCDALFMAPPVWTRLSSLTGNKAYLDYSNKEWWVTTDYLYDTEEHLYFRDDRYFDQREANGKKMFWCRGNGWVFGGLVRVISDLPGDFPDRRRYVQIYQEMAAKLLRIQGADGLWRSSLLDPETYPPPEASGSGFFCYGLAWGINRGYLDSDTYLPVVKKAWQGLVGCVHADGKLGWVQPIGAAPGAVTADLTEVYGVGSFLLAGSELYKLGLRENQPVVQVHVTNPIAVFRAKETLSLAWSDLTRQLHGLTPANVAVLDMQSNRFLVTQIVEGRDLLFQADLSPGQRHSFWVMKRPAGVTPVKSAVTTFARFVPERMDDFAWENDRIAFRMYGPALEVETVSPGIDVWVKKVPYPVVDKWYMGKDYHKDHGEGADFYKVGPTLGCGGLGIFVDETLHMSRNFRSSRVLAEGPIRTVFELTFDVWDAGGMKVSEVKRISLDLGSNLSRVDSQFTCTGQSSLPMAVGIVKRKAGQVSYDMNGQWLAYWEPAHPKNGVTGCAVVVPEGGQKFLDTDKHVLLTAKTSKDLTLTTYAGACWNKSGQFTSLGQWQTYVAEFAERVAHPVKITVSP
jgi:unsaturated rhamnogalacturonyl hydrolase